MVLNSDDFSVIVMLGVLFLLEKPEVGEEVLIPGCMFLLYFNYTELGVWVGLTLGIEQ